jgi:hypothetical protein
MSVAESPHESSDLIVVSAKEAVERAKPLPSDDDMAVEGLTDDEWDAFERAIVISDACGLRGGRASRRDGAKSTSRLSMT